MDAKSPLAPVIVSIIILFGFGGISFLAMKPGVIGEANQNVVLLLMGQWSALAAMAASYWLGSSNSSAKKDDQLAKKDETIRNVVEGAKP
jgi:hypothetical protein